MRCYACQASRLCVTHTYDDGQVARRRRRCERCGLRVVTEERVNAPRPAPAPRETLWVLHDRACGRVWLGRAWPTPAEGLEHLGRFVAVDAAFEARFRAHFSAAHLEESWYREQVAVPLRRFLGLDPRGRLGAPSRSAE